MRPAHVLSAGLLWLLAACGAGDSGEKQGRAAAPSGRMTYAECMKAADQQASRAETVVKARECLRLPDAPPPGSTLPAGVPPPPGQPLGAAGAAADVRSVYTSLQPVPCQVIERQEETGATVSRCPGVAGHTLMVNDDDARMSVDVVTPDGRKHPLNYWSVVTRGFSSLGERAEWRMRGEQPIALIVRVDANEHPDDPDRITSYLAVAKITLQGICVTDRITGVVNANQLARRAADASAGKPCATEPGEPLKIRSPLERSF